MGKSTKDPKNVWSVLKQLKPILNKEGLPPLDEMQYHYTKLSLSLSLSIKKKKKEKAVCNSFNNKKI